MNHDDFLDSDAHDSFLDGGAPSAPVAKPRLNAFSPMGFQVQEGGVPLPSALERAIVTGGKEAPPVIGGMIGSALGTPAGPLGRAVGAGLGGAAGKAYQRIGEYATGMRSPSEDTALGNLGDIASSGLAQAAGEGIMMGIGTGAKAVAPDAVRLGAQALKVGPAIKESIGTAVLKEPEILFRGKPMDVVKKGYQAFEAKTGLKGLDQLAGERAKAWGPHELYEAALSVANKIKAGIAPTEQELYLASQAENGLARLARRQNPDAAAMLGTNSLTEAGQLADKALETIHPEYAGLRKDYFEGKARDAFSSILPQNKNLTPNVLRTHLAFRDALGGLGLGVAATGHPLGLLSPALISPAMAGLAIRGATLASPLLRRLGGVGVRVGSEKAVRTAEDYLNQP